MKNEILSDPEAPLTVFVTVKEMVYTNEAKNTPGWGMRTKVSLFKPSGAAPD